MLRVTEDERGLVVEGELVGPWVAELQRVAEEHLRRRPVPASSLDLAAVSYVDASGVALLRGLLEAGMELRAANRFVDELLRAPA
jgi:ABC-type transporter Mla MlaB component